MTSKISKYDTAAVLRYGCKIPVLAEKICDNFSEREASDAFTFSVQQNLGMGGLPQSHNAERFIRVALVSNRFKKFKSSHREIAQYMTDLSDL